MKKTTFLFAIFIAFQTLTFAQYTSIPDNNFEAKLIMLGIDSGVPDNQILTAVAQARTSFVDLSGADISDLTGLEAFTSLTSLKASGNPFTTINLSLNIALIDLNLSDSDISTLDLSGNTNLETINVSYSPNLLGLDLTDNMLLEVINTEECNALTSLNITGLTTLIDVNLWDNDLMLLDVSDNAGLQSLIVRQNQITILDLSSNSALTEVNVRDNGMTGLNMRNGNNANTSFIGNFNNNLTCIFVDDDSEPNLGTWTIDGNSNFVETEPECATLSIDAVNTVVFSMYPNPASSVVTVSSKSENATVEIFNITGKRILIKTLNFGDNNLNISTLSSGVYLAKFSSENKIETKKLIIK